MTWQQYVEFTATTALPVASDPEYLRLGVLEEAYEALEAYSACCAAIHGKQKRILRGDAPNVLQAKDDAIAIAKRRLVEELGDLAWYVARTCALHTSTTYRDELQCSYEENALKDVAFRIGRLSCSPNTALVASLLLSGMVELSGVSLETVLDVNVAKLTARKSAGTIQGEGER